MYKTNSVQHPTTLPQKKETHFQWKAKLRSFPGVWLVHFNSITKEIAHTHPSSPPPQIGHNSQFHVWHLYLKCLNKLTFKMANWSKTSRHFFISLWILQMVGLVLPGCVLKWLYLMKQTSLQFLCSCIPTEACTTLLDVTHLLFFFFKVLHDFPIGHMFLHCFRLGFSYNTIVPQFCP